MARRKVVNYLNNKDILKEIHKSKSSYSYFIDKEYDIFDIIVNDLSEINDEVILLAKEKRVKRLIENDKDAQYNSGIAKKNIVPLNLTVDDIPDTDLVFRVMTYEHIPLQEGRVKTPKKEADYRVRLFFKPFKHYIIKDDQFVEVGRSHWKNGLHNGEFCQDHGRITDKLGMMYMELANRFARKGNYRNYCVDAKTEALTQRGWQSINSLISSDIILSCDPETHELKWSTIKDIYRNDDYDGKMYKLEADNFDAYVTEGHKWLTNNGLKTIDDLDVDDILILDPINEDFKCAAKNIRYGNVSVTTEIYNGTVWCPSTEYGTFIARRNDTIYVTGNSYKEDMVDRAIEQLVSAGLSFDESKTDNPFAYFTVCCTTSFTSVLNEEKKNQNLRDNLIEAHGGSPSFTRQVENEFTQKMESYYEEKGLKPPKPLNVPKVGFKRKSAPKKD